MPIGPIGAGAGISLPPLPPVGTAPATPGSGESFGDMVTSAVGNLQQTQATADSLAVQAATGQLNDVHDYMIAATKATLATELTVAVRNKAVQAFTEIMGMPI